MKRLNLLFLFLLSCTLIHADDEYNNYKEWDDTSVKGIYVEISQTEAQENGYDEYFTDGDGYRYFEKVKVSEGLYKIEVKEKVDSKFWGVAHTKLYIKFSFNPFLFKFDEGVLEWDGYNGNFYKKP